MRKTDGITKYVIRWQLLRSQIKGNKATLDEKIERATDYFEETESYDRWERVYNWMEGLLRGYKSAKDTEKQHYIKSVMRSFHSIKPLIITALEKDEEQEYEYLQSLNEKDLVCVWKDNFKRTEEYLKKGYYHEEVNVFMNWMWKNSSIDYLVKYRWSIDYLEALRRGCREKKKNEHYFFF